MGHCRLRARAAAGCARTAAGFVSGRSRASAGLRAE
eukprot:CAMPEP_0183351614 /NCGR_PEP_ID=MMETSP0164_2-20130417/26100_1 /TAXON_ID=221442 /ORGANISM="Coccolithus pelagicus ssp braarudi, Strain PLY182g" /LENGTH=35 /DNA_ID= /DNA_START= /DNA_END= /DNA_ORIENTATION=